MRIVKEKEKFIKTISKDKKMSLVCSIPLLFSFLTVKDDLNA
jgi:hypothetical protein